MKMNKNEIEQLCKKTPDDRYMSFINNVRHTDSLYVLYNKSKREIALNIAKDTRKYLYLFPDEYSGALFIEANSDMKKYVSHKWELTFFIETAIPRLSTENVENAFIFPTPAGLGYNATFNKIVKDIHCEGNQAVDIGMMKKLLDYLDNNLKTGCKHDYTLTKLFCQENNINFNDIVNCLREHGGFCDCEVLANVEESL